MVKVGHNGPEETTYIKQGVGLRIDMITALLLLYPPHAIVMRLSKPDSSVVILMPEKTDLLGF